MRHFIRHPSDIPIECHITHCEPCRRSALKDISLGGLCFQTPDALERGCVIQVTIPRQSRGLSFMSRSKRLIGVANAAPPSGTTSRWFGGSLTRLS